MGGGALLSSPRGDHSRHATQYKIKVGFAFGGPRVLINAQIAVPAFLGHNHRLSKKRISPLSSIRRIIETRGHACADPRPSRRLGRDYTSVGLLLDADAHPPG